MTGTVWPAPMDGDTTQTRSVIPTGQLSLEDVDSPNPPNNRNLDPVESLAFMDTPGDSARSRVATPRGSVTGRHAHAHAQIRVVRILTGAHARCGMLCIACSARHDQACSPRHAPCGSKSFTMISDAIAKERSNELAVLLSNALTTVSTPARTIC